MIEHAWSVLCSKSTIDAETNNISLIEVLEQISIATGPPAAGTEGLIPLRVELVTLWMRAQPDQPGHGRGRVSFVRPSGTMTESIQEFDIPLQTTQRMRHRQRY